MSVATHSSTLNVATASTAFSNAATTKLTANTRYQLTLAANQRVDPAVNVVVEVDADGAGAGGYVVAAAGTYSFDYLSGIVTFGVDQGVNATVRVTGAALTVVPAAEIESVTLSVMADIVEVTNLADTGYRTRKATLADFSADLSGFSPPMADLDAGAGTVAMDAILEAGARLFLEVKPNGQPAFRAWVKLEGIDTDHAPGEVLKSTLKAVASAIKANDGVTYVAFGYAT